MIAFTSPPTGGAAVNKDENIGASQILYSVATTDADGDTPTLTISDQTPAGGMFILDGMDLKRSSASFDYESTKQFIITFRYEKHIERIM